MNSIRDMLEDRSTKIALAGALIIAFIAPTLFSLIGGGGDGSQAIAYVNNEVVTIRELQQKFYQNTQLKKQLEEQLGPYAKMFLEYYGLGGDLQQATMDQLVKEKLFVSFKDKLGFAISEEYIQDKLTDPLFIKGSLGNIIPDSVLLSDGTIDKDMLERYLNERGITPEKFDEIIKSTLDQELVNSLISQSVEIPEDLIKELYIKQEVPRAYSVIKLPLKEYIENISKQNISEDELQSYYATHVQDYKVPEKRSAKLWVFTPESFNISLKDEEIQEYYEENKESFKVDDEYKSLDVVKDEIKNILMQEKFLEHFNSQAGSVISKAQENPQAFHEFIKDQNAQQEELDYVTNTGSIQHKKLFDLKDENNRAFYTQDSKGYILELTDIKPSSIKSYNEIQEQVKEDLVKSKAQQSLKEDLNKAYSQIIEENKNIKDLAQEFNTHIKNANIKDITIDPKDKEKSKEELPAESKRYKKMLNLTQPNTATYVIEDDSGYLIVLDELKDAKQDAFADKKSELIHEAKSLLENSTYQTFVANLRKNAKIKYNI